MSDILILGVSIATTLLITRFGVARRWVRAVSARPGASLLIFIAVGSLFIGGAGGADPSLNVHGARIMRAIIVSFIFLISVIGIFFQPASLKRAGSASGWMAMYAFLAMLSAVYSVSPVVSLWKGFEVLSFVTMGVYIARFLVSHEDVQWVIDLICLMMLYFSVSVIISLLISPSEALPKSGSATGTVISAAQSVFPPIYPNSVTQFAALLSCLTLCQLLSPFPRRGKKILVPIFIIGVLVIILGHSRTSILAALIAVMGILVMGRHAKTALTVSAIASAGLLYGFASIFMSFMLRGQTEEQFLGLSGRIHYWQEVWKVFVESPLLGHGFYTQRVILDVSSVDNTYLQILVGLGLIGLAIVCLVIVKIVYQLLKYRPRRHDTSQDKLLWLELVTLFIIVFMRSLTGPTFQDFNINLVLLMLLIIALSTIVRLRITNQKHIDSADERLMLPINKIMMRSSPRLVHAKRKEGDALN
jgi:O-antigen ligase